MSALRLVFCSALVTTVLIGCGGPTEKPEDNIKRQTQAKLEAMKQLAEAVQKNDQIAINAAVEGLTSNSLDVKQYSTEAKELVEIYNKQVKDKLKGEHAAQVKGIVSAIEKDLKK